MKTVPTTNPTPAPTGPIQVAPGRRSWLRAGVAIGAASVTGVHAQSAPWPAKPVKIVSPYPAGGSNDAVARTLAAKLSDLWNQRVFVENKPGANNRIATQELARAAPDGYHLMLAAAPHGANPGLYDHKLPYDTVKDFVPIIRATVSPVGFWVPSASPFRTLDDMAKAARPSSSARSSRPRSTNGRRSPRRPACGRIEGAEMSTRFERFSLNTPRRRALAVGLAAVAGALHGPVRAQATAWPTKPVRVIVPYPAGGVVDVMTRAVTQRMQADLGQPIIVEAKPGANANIGADTVATAAPDGHTWLVSAAYLLNNPLIETGLRWKPADFVPVARFALSPSYFVVPVSSPARTLKEWVEFARREPGQQYGEGGTGTPQSMSIQMLWASAGLRLEPVMYKGAPPIVPDLIAGQLSMSVLPSTVAIPQVRSGKLRALANTSTTRSPSLPDVPTMAEAGFPEASVLSWYGFHVPTGTPTEIVRRIAELTGRAATSAEVGDRLTAAGGESGFLAGPDFIAFMTDEQQRWARFVEAAKKNAR